MKAIIKPAFEKNRKILSDILPLDTPLRITIAPSHYCNLKCFYCTHSLRQSELINIGFQYKNMEMNLFKKIVNQLKSFGQPLKLIAFSGLGEPLLNSNLAEMVRILKKENVCDKIEIFSNAVLLNPKTVHELVDAGLDYFRISLQGLNAQSYKDICGVQIKYEKFLENISYFYYHKGDCKIYIKILNIMLKNKMDENQFYHEYGDICDELYIETLTNNQLLMDDCGGKSSTEKQMYGNPLVVPDVCPMLFYALTIDACGKVFPCVTYGLPEDMAVGDLQTQETLLEIWNGSILHNLRCVHLKGERSSLNICSECKNFASLYHKEDDLDTKREVLFDRYKMRFG